MQLRNSAVRPAVLSPICCLHRRNSSQNRAHMRYDAIPPRAHDEGSVGVYVSTKHERHDRITRMRPGPVGVRASCRAVPGPGYRGKVKTRICIRQRQMQINTVPHAGWFEDTCVRTHKPKSPMPHQTPPTNPWAATYQESVRMCKKKEPGLLSSQSLSQRVPGQSVVFRNHKAIANATVAFTMTRMLRVS